MLDQLFHAGDDYYDIEVAIRNGHTAYARERLRDILQDEPCAEVWYLSALVALNRQQCIQFLEQALALNPDHDRARRVLEHVHHLFSETESDSAPLLARLRHVLRGSWLKLPH